MDSPIASVRGHNAAVETYLAIATGIEAPKPPRVLPVGKVTSDIAAYLRTRKGVDGKQLVREVAETFGVAIAYMTALAYRDGRGHLQKKEAAR